MKKSNKKSRIDGLEIDIIEYAFIEWLVRQSAFSAFKANYESANKLREAAHKFRGSFRDQLRLHIQVALIFPELGIGRLISSAFPFDCTSEGADFWQKQSDAWKRFCTKFRM